MAYKVFVYNVGTNKEAAWETEATTWGQLMDETRERGVTISEDSKVMIVNNDVELIDRTSVINRFNPDGTAIPDDEELTIYVTQKKAKGAAKETIEEIVNSVSQPFNYNSGRSFLSRLAKAGEPEVNATKWSNFKGPEVTSFASSIYEKLKSNSVSPSSAEASKTTSDSKKSSNAKVKNSSSEISRIEDLELKILQIEEKLDLVLKSLVVENKTAENAENVETKAEQQEESAEELARKEQAAKQAKIQSIKDKAKKYKNF